ncbi:glycosyltransferase family 2 protein [Candidatus Uhrbacteria bacterium]|nr:glycosyltransferase family 2 protein [Candidatus Uhrbacteria bacterium]
MPRLSVHLVAWNGAKYIPYLFESLRAQTYKDWELLAIDNNSQKDNTAVLIEQELKNFPVPARLIRNKENNGFAGGHNQAIRFTVDSSQSTVYFQLLNQDMYLAPNYFERVVAMMDAHLEAGAGQGILLRWRFAEIRNPKSEIRNNLSDVVDTMGLKVVRNRRVVDWCTGKRIRELETSELDTSNTNAPIRQFASPLEVFGVSGALPIYRRKAVEDVAFEGPTRPTFAISKSSVGQVFDEDFFSYKEDVDLAFRLRSAGWKAYVEPAARAWHDRTAAGPREMSDQAALKNRKGRPDYVNRYSYRNHLIVLLKNEHRANFMHDWPWIVLYELKKLVYLLFTDWKTLKGLGEVRGLWKRTMEKRRFIMRHYKIKPSEMRKWYV